MRLTILSLLILVVAGIVAIGGVLPIGQPYSNWPSTTATVEHIGSKYNMPPPQIIGGVPFSRRGGPRPVDVTVRYSYEVNGTMYQGNYKISMNVLEPNLFMYYLPKQCTVKYDPHNPQLSVLLDAIDLHSKFIWISVGILTALIVLAVLIKSALGLGDSSNL